MVSGKYSMKCEQGATLFVPFQLTEDDGTAIDLTGYSARMMVRSAYSDASPVLDVGTGGWITIPTPANGEVQILVPDTETDDLEAGNYLYDVELEDSAGFVTRILEGPFIVTPQVTK